MVKHISYIITSTIFLWYNIDKKTIVLILFTQALTGIWLRYCDVSRSRRGNFCNNGCLFDARLRFCYHFRFGCFFCRFSITVSRWLFLISNIEILCNIDVIKKHIYTDVFSISDYFSMNSTALDVTKLRTIEFGMYFGNKYMYSR